MDKLRHEALRDTMWIGKSGSSLWLMLTGVAAGAILLALVLH